MKNLKILIGGLVKLKGCYPTWNINEKDKNLLTAWYNVLDFVSDEKFIEMVNVYSKTRKFPPQSPRDLYESYLEERKSKHVPFEIIWQNMTKAFLLFGFDKDSYLSFVKHDLKKDKDALDFASDKQMIGMIQSWRDSANDYAGDIVKTKMMAAWEKRVDEELQKELKEEAVLDRLQNEEKLKIGG